MGVGVAALAVILVASSGIDFPPGGTNTTGAIVPAQRFRAEQPATTGVSAPGQSESAQRAAQGAPGNIGDARSSDTRAIDSLKPTAAAAMAASTACRTAAAYDGRTCTTAASRPRLMAAPTAAADAMRWPLTLPMAAPRWSPMAAPTRCTDGRATRALIGRPHRTMAAPTLTDGRLT